MAAEFVYTKSRNLSPVWKNQVLFFDTILWDVKKWVAFSNSLWQQSTRLKNHATFQLFGRSECYFSVHYCVMSKNIESLDGYIFQIAFSSQIYNYKITQPSTFWKKKVLFFGTILCNVKKWVAFSDSLWQLSVWNVPQSFLHCTNTPLNFQMFPGFSKKPKFAMMKNDAKCTIAPYLYFSIFNRFLCFQIMHKNDIKINPLFMLNLRSYSTLNYLLNVPGNFHNFHNFCN